MEARHLAASCSIPSSVVTRGLHVSFTVIQLFLDGVFWSPRPPASDCCMQNLSYSVLVSPKEGGMCASKVPLKLLDSVTGHFQPGEMTALMGPSGCGEHHWPSCLLRAGLQAYLNGCMAASTCTHRNAACSQPAVLHVP